MDNHGTKGNVGFSPMSKSKELADFDKERINDYHMRVEALHAAVAIQPKDKPEGQQNPSVGQVVADAEKILSYLKGE